MKKLFVFIFVMVFFASNSFAFKSQDLQRIFDDITFWGNSSVNVVSGKVPDNIDSYWTSTGSEFQVIAQEAGFAPRNVFGIYDINNPKNKVEIVKGNYVKGSSFEIKTNGEVWVSGYYTGKIFRDRMFGFYIDSSYYKEGGVWYSDTRLNDDNTDHMFAYQGKGDVLRLPVRSKSWSPADYILAFEDLRNGGDKDYTDFVVFVENISPAFLPVPSSQGYHRYPTRVNPILNNQLRYASPMGVGDLGKDVLNLRVKMLPFDQPVDIYIALSFKGSFFYISNLNGFSKSPVKWRSGISELVNTSLYGDINTVSLDSGGYRVYVMVTPKNRLDCYYLWETYFFVPVRIGL